VNYIPPYRFDTTKPLLVQDTNATCSGETVPPESDLQNHWKHLQFPCDFLTLTGQTITVLNGGQLNKNAGPDFRHGMLSVNGQIFSGDIEIHRRIHGWIRHRHGEDPRFRNVVLHVIGESPDTVPDFASSYNPQYTVVLQYPAGKSTTYSNKEQCRYASVGRKSISLLRQFGFQRISAKAGRYRRTIKSGLPADHLWLQKTLRCLGYGHNSDRMEHLSDSLQLGRLLECSHHHTRDQLFEIALGLTGYHKYFEIEIPFWKSISQRYRWSGFQYYQWKPLRTRPANHPVLRVYLFLVSAASWYALYNNQSGQHGIRDTINSLKTRIPIPQRFREHFYGRLASLGVSRAVEILINAWIPLWCRGNNQNRFQEIRAYTEPLPAIPVYSAFRRFIGRTEWAVVLDKSRLHPVLLQGLLHLRQRLCRVEACERCPMIHEVTE